MDRVTGHVSPLKLPDYDPGVSQVSWFRDYAAYCGVTATGKAATPWLRNWPPASPCSQKNWTATILTPNPIPTRCARSLTGRGNRYG